MSSLHWALPEARLWVQDVWASSLLGWRSQDRGEWGKEGKEANIGYCPTMWTTRISCGLVLLAEAKKYALESSNGRRERAGAFVHQFPFVFCGLLVGGDHGHWTPSHCWPALIQTSAISKAVRVKSKDTCSNKAVSVKGIQFGNSQHLLQFLAPAVD